MRTCTTRDIADVTIIIAILGGGATEGVAYTGGMPPKRKRKRR